MKRVTTCHPERPHWVGGLCRRCHQRTEYARDPAKREAKRQYYLANRDRILEAAQRRHASKRPELLEQMRVRHAANRERNNAISRAWRTAHLEEARAASRRRYAVHRAEAIEQTRQWAAAHPEKLRENWHRANARRKQAELCTHPSCLALGPIQLAWQTNPHECYICGQRVSLKARRGDPAQCHFDHVVPISRGGVHCAQNIRPACAPCNLRKSKWLPHELGIAI